MVEFDVIGTDAEIDTNDPVGSLMTILTVILGAGVLFMVLPIGRQLGSRINSAIAAALGTDVGDAQAGLSFGGD